jgi:hypothetical protein
MGPAVTHPWCLQFIIKVSTQSYLYAMCTYGTLLHPTCTYGTYSYSSMMSAIRHKSLCSVLSLSDVYLLRMATGQARIGWSLHAPKTKTRSWNPNPNWTPIRVEIHHQNQTRRYLKPEQIPKTWMDTWNPWINIHIFTCINKRQQIINIFMSQFWIDLII